MGGGGLHAFIIFDERYHYREIEGKDRIAEVEEAYDIIRKEGI